jgi:hypothetical protein
VGNALIGLLGVVVGALAGLGGARITANANTRAERERQERELVAEREREARVAVGQLAGVMSTAMQTIDWFAWRAARRPSTFDAATIDGYDADMQRLLPALMESMARVAAISADGFKRFRPYTEEVFDLDHEVSDCATLFATDADGSRRALAGYQDRSDDLFRRFQVELARWAGAPAPSVASTSQPVAPTSQPVAASQPVAPAPAPSTPLPTSSFPAPTSSPVAFVASSASPWPSPAALVASSISPWPPPAMGSARSPRLTG